MRLVADGRIPAGPTLAAGLPHGLHGVVVAVFVILLLAPRDALLRAELGQIIQAPGDLLFLRFVADVDAGAVQGDDRGRRAGNALSPPLTSM